MMVFVVGARVLLMGGCGGGDWLLWVVAPDMASFR